MDALVATWQNKVNVTDTSVFGGDLAAAGTAPNSWSSGAFSKERAGGDLIDYLELDFTFDSPLTAGHGVAVGLCLQDPGQVFPSSAWESAWVWNTDNTLEAYEGGNKRYDSGVATTLPMSCRIIYNAGVLTFRSNAGSDILRFTSARTVAELTSIMRAGLNIKALFWGTSGSFHATLKATTTAPVSIGYPAYFTQVLRPCPWVSRSVFAQGFPTRKSRPTEGKIWPRNM